MRGWLGDYGSFENVFTGLGNIFRAMWHAHLFFCHQRIDYTQDDWHEQAMKDGPLCLGFLKARAQWTMPDRVGEGGDPAVIRAQHVMLKQIAAGKLVVDVFPRPNDWRDHHMKVLEFTRTKSKD